MSFLLGSMRRVQVILKCTGDSLDLERNVFYKLSGGPNSSLKLVVHEINISSRHKVHAGLVVDTLKLLNRLQDGGSVGTARVIVVEVGVGLPLVDHINDL